MRRSSREDAVGRVLASLGRGALGRGYTPEVAGRMLETIGRVASERTRNQLLAAFRALDTKAGALALTGAPVPVSWLAPAAAEKVLREWKQSRVRFKRDLGSTAVSLAASALYGHPGREWERIRYPGPLGLPPDEPKRLAPLEFTSDETINCDVVVVGSGSGGGCVAGQLALAGFDVVVVEKGGYRSESDFTHIGADALRDMYLYSGILTTTDLGVRIVAGSTLGGGTVVNWSTSWKTPGPVLEEWARVSGVDAFVSGEVEASLDEVAARLNVTVDQSAAGRRDELLEEGLKRLGWHVDLMPRNVRGCTQDEQCGYCPYGCRIGAKQSTTRTYLEDAAQAGARLLVDTDVRTVRIADGRARGVEAVCGPHQVSVKARAVVVAGGSIETPALLLRSGLRGRVGYNLRLHPGTAAAGVFDDDVHMWEGTMQARYSNQLGGPWHGTYGATLETGPLHPGEWALAVPWLSAEQHRELMGKYAKTSLVAVLSRDTASGRVTIDRQGAPRVHYSVNAEDERRIGEGVIAGAKVLEAAGARQVFSLHRNFISYVPDGPSAHERWADETRHAGYRNGQVTFGSFHQMGSCAMGVDPTRSVVGADNESHEVANLFVVDASTFPTPSGVNPMLSVFGIANRAAKKIAARLS